jgi:NAD(P)H dehydrogenase (quinone)
MTKLVIIYDSKTGNTEKMAKSISEGAKSVKGVEVILKKIGESFSLTILDEADAIILGAPAHYAYVTPDMRDFLACIRGMVDDKRLNLIGKIGAAFGSYGWDGGISIEKMAVTMEKFGIKMHSEVLTQVSPLPFPKLTEEAIQECRNLGKTISEKASKN